MLARGGLYMPNKWRDSTSRYRRLTTFPTAINWQVLRDYWGNTRPFPGYNPIPYPGEDVTDDNPMPKEWYDKFLAECQKYLGYPYGRQNLATENPTSFDCSSFIGFCGWKSGVLPYYTEVYWTTFYLRPYCAKVADGEEAPGDLCFWSNGAGSEHVGLYIGNNYIIDSSSGGVAYRDYRVHTSIPFLGWYRIPQPYPGEGE